MAHSQAQRETITKIMRAKRRNPDADVSDLRRELKTLTLEERIKAYVATAPLPTPEQRDRLAALLTSPQGRSEPAVGTGDHAA
jgi:hypothetical protein